MQDKSAKSLARRDFLKTSAKLSVMGSVVGLGGFALSACSEDSKNSAFTNNLQKTQNIQGDTMKSTLTPKAQQNFEKLFGDPSASGLAQSDPDFLAIM
ncbi:hypothetical protein [Helicobacter muridarum]|uniref:Uncharacterized protein n=1 Tax=Helicobacter muridarum TaxID=216 RepID=A0A377PWW9_9HELI|nr:hypothetical protein [Helicobacter muridarum]STQ86912.1 Uncharacterised protein [Helicobacter muridarum]